MTELNPHYCTFLMSTSGQGRCVAQSGDGWADMPLVLLLGVAWLQASMLNKRNAHNFKTMILKIFFFFLTLNNSVILYSPMLMENHSITVAAYS